MLFQNTFSKTLRKIASASDSEISTIIAAVIKRYRLLFPEWEILFLAVPKDPVQRKLQLEMMLEQLQSGTLEY